MQHYRKQHAEISGDNIGIKSPLRLIVKVDRVRKLSLEILDKHSSHFGENFNENKKTLEKIAIVRSKQLRNKIAGFITKHIKREARYEAQTQNIQEQEEDEGKEIVEEQNPEENATIEQQEEQQQQEAKTESDDDDVDAKEEGSEPIEIASSENTLK